MRFCHRQRPLPALSSEMSRQSTAILEQRVPHSRRCGGPNDRAGFGEMYGSKTVPACRMSWPERPSPPARYPRQFAFKRREGRHCAVPVLYLTLRFLEDLAGSGDSYPA